MLKHILAIDIGGTKIAGAMVQLQGEETPQLLHTSMVPTHAELGGPQVAARVVDFARQLADLGKGEGLFPETVAISTAGVVDVERKAIVSATSLMPGWGGIQLGDMLRDALGLPVCMLNDVHSHALGELAWGAGRGYHSALVITVGTGIGGAVINDGKLVFGAHGAAGHLGHVSYQDGPQLLCSCGASGHVEAIASGSGLARLYNHLLAEQPELKCEQLTSGLAVSMAAAENPLAAQALQISGRALGQSLGNLANSFDPECVIICGSMIENGEAWWQSVSDGYRSAAMQLLAETPLFKGELAGQAALLGVVAFAEQQSA